MAHQCPHCDQGLPNAESLHNHVRFAHNLICITHLSDGTPLNIERIGGYNGYLPCPNPACEKTFYHSSAIRTHLRKSLCRRWMASQVQRGSQPSPATIAAPKSDRTPLAEQNKGTGGPVRSTRRHASTTTTRSIRGSKISTSSSSSFEHIHISEEEEEEEDEEELSSDTGRSPPLPTNIKQEEIVLECSLEEIENGEFWSSLGDGVMMLEKMVPTVDLDDVPDNVLDRKQVKAMARVISLGKFCITTQGAYIDAQLARPTHSYARPFQISVVLDTEVVERHLGQPHASLINLAQNSRKKANLLQRLAKFRDSVQSSREIECTFDGVRESKPLVKEIKLDV